MKYAAYSKRIFSMLIDAAVLYICIIGAYYLYPQRYEPGITVGAFFLVNIMLHFLLYKNQGHTYGEKLMGLKIIFTRKPKNKNLCYLEQISYLKTVIESRV